MDISYNLEKLIWDENDFEQMGWHDSKVYAIAFEGEKFELALDIDYILKWLNPSDKESNYKFWVAPATLVFSNVYNLNIIQQSLGLEIQDVYRENPVKPKNEIHIEGKTEYDWTIETTSGKITFKAAGYKQYFRKPPALLDSQKIDFKERGGISFNEAIDSNDVG
jgi:hypothetical protein